VYTQKGYVVTDAEVTPKATHVQVAHDVWSTQRRHFLKLKNDLSDEVAEYLTAVESSQLFVARHYSEDVVRRSSSSSKNEQKSFPLAPRS
jgi:hypothetical protein